MLVKRFKPGSRSVTNHGISEVVPLATDLRVGTRLAGYHLQALAGRGGMGVVYRAEHVHLGRTVALKLLVPDLVGSEGFRERFVRESRTAAAIHHPNIITIYDAGEAEGLLYIAMQYVDGTDLAELLRRRGALEPSRALYLVDQVAGALDAAHAHGIVHRDVKPENVLIENDRCYLTDFGLTKRISSASGLTARGQFVGTIDYMAPEQIEGRPVDGRADVYALGCLMYHVLGGTVPYQKDSEVSVIYAHLQETPPALTTRRPDLPPGIDQVIAKAMAKDREDRHPTCAALMDDLRALIGGASRAVSEAAPAERAKVLVAAHDPSTRALIRASLGEGRFRLVEAEDGDATIEVARRERPDLLFLDWSMEGRPGADVCRALRDDPATSDTKIVTITSRARPGEMGELTASGADDYIAKPFSPLQVLFKVRDLLGLEVTA